MKDTRMRRAIFTGLCAALLFVVPSSDAAAQRNRDNNRRGDQPSREQLQRRLQERLGNMLRRELGLNDAQMRQLSEVNQRFDVRRRELFQREVANRRAMRAEIMRGDSADQSRVDGYVTAQFRIERERIDLTEAEQRDLGRFLTAVQRARYMGIQEQIRRELDQLRGRGRPNMGPPDSSRRRPPGSRGLEGPS
jgi:ribosomal protein S18